MHYENLVGTLPDSIVNLTSLDILRVSANEIRGTIPESNCIEIILRGRTLLKCLQQKQM